MKVHRPHDRLRFTDPARGGRGAGRRVLQTLVAAWATATVATSAIAAEPTSTASWANLLASESSDLAATDAIGLFAIEPVVIPTAAMLPQEDVLEEAKRALENSRRGDVDSLSDRLDAELDAALRDILEDRPMTQSEDADSPPSDRQQSDESDRDASTSKDDADADESDDLDIEDRPQPERTDGRFELPRLTASRTTQSGEVPKGLNDAVVTPLAESGIERSGDWTWTTRTWAAANTFSHPLYFEDRMLERHGHERWGYAQPLVSGARFYTSLALLPYLSAIERPCDCRYTLGYYRSGTCTPRFFQRPPWDRRAILQQSAATAAGMAIVP